MPRAQGPLKGGSVSTAFERPKVKSTVIIKRIWQYLSSYRWMLGFTVVLGVLSNLLALVGPKLSGKAIDAIKPGQGMVDFQTVFHYAALMAGFYVVSSVLNYLLSVLMVRLSRNVVYQMRKDVYSHLLKLPVGFFDQRPIGDMLSVFSYDIDTVNASLSNDLVQMLSSVVTVVGSFWMMWSISPLLLLVFVVTVPAAALFTRYNTKRVRPLFRARSGYLGALNGYAEEITGGIRTIHCYGREQVFLDRFSEKNDEACRANYEADYFSSMTGPMVSFINNISLALISMFGAMLYMSGSITLGSVSSFVLYSRKFSGPINEFSNIINELQSALAAAERVFALLDQEPEAPDAADAAELSHVTGEVDIKDVSFEYTPDSPVLKNLTLHAKPGQVIAIVGPTGAGKTTVINLLMRFYDAGAGTITIDGQSIYQLSRASLRKAFSMVLQDTWLFSGTIFENLAYGKENVTLEEVRAAAKSAKIDRFIQSLPDGYDTVLQDGGSNISKGQKQLLTIARAMLLDAPMLILDEATSNVDTQTEQQIQAAMLKLMQGRTCFVIAHRLSTIQNADQIAVLQDGMVIECGTHLELLKKGGYYSTLYHAQFE